MPGTPLHSCTQQMTVLLPYQWLSDTRQLSEPQRDWLAAWDAPRSPYRGTAPAPPDRTAAGFSAGNRRHQ